MDGWWAVIKGGGWPAVVLAGLAIIIKWPTISASFSKEWGREDAKREERLDQQQEAFWGVKDRELERLRSEVTTNQTRVGQLLDRINRLMDAIAWWRDLARDMRTDRLGDRLAFRSYVQLHGIKPLDLPDVPPVPRVTEEDTADEFRAKPAD